MRRIKIKRTVGLISIVGALVSGTSYADQPKVINWTTIGGATSGLAAAGLNLEGDSQVKIKLSFWSQEDAKSNFLVVFPACGEDSPIAGKPVTNLDGVIANKGASPVYNTRWVDPGPRWRVCPDLNAVFLAANGTADVNLKVDFLRLTNQGLAPKIKALVYAVDQDLLKQTQTADALALRFREKPADATVELDLYYTLKSNQWTLSDYANVFGLPSRNGVAASGDLKSVADSMPINVESYRRVLQVPGSLSDDKGALLKSTLEKVKSAGSGVAGDQVCYSDYSQSINSGNVSKALMAGPTVKGKFSTKWSADHSLHPGFGFWVDLQQTNASGTPSRSLGSAWVQSDGTWSIQTNVNPAFIGGYVRAYYRSYNNYYAPQDQNNSKYSWVDPVSSVPNGTQSFDVGHRYADTDGGKYTGVGELVDAAMTMWSRLYWDAGLNPVPSSPLKFYFPNSWENCGGSSP